MCSIQTDDYANKPKSDLCKSTPPLDETRNSRKEAIALKSGVRHELGSNSPQDNKSISNRMKGPRCPTSSTPHIPSNAKTQRSSKACPSSYKEAAKAVQSALDNELNVPFLLTCSGWDPRGQSISLPGIGKFSSSSVSDCSARSGEDGENASHNAKLRPVYNANNNRILKTAGSASSDSENSIRFERKGKEGKARRKSRSKKRSVDRPGEESETEVTFKDSNLLGALLEDEVDEISSEDLTEDFSEELRRGSIKGSEKGSRRKSMRGSRRGSRRTSRHGSAPPSRKDSKDSRKNSMRLFKKHKKGLKRAVSSEISVTEKVRDGTKEAKRRIVHVYKILDHERSGKLTMRHINVGVLALGLVPDEKEMNWLEDKMIEYQSETEDANLITLETFMAVMTVSLRDNLFKPASRRELQMAFRTLDTNHQGFLTPIELREALTREGEPLTERELEALIEEGIPEDYPVLNYNDYVPLMLRTMDLLPY